MGHVSELRNTLALSVSYYYSEYFFLSFRNHRSSPSIVQSQQLARLHVSIPTIWISQALVWQEWQCLHRGSLVRTVNLIGSLYHQVSLCRSHPAGLHQVSRSSQFFLCDLLKGNFLLSMLSPETDLTRFSHLIHINAVFATRQVKLCGGWFSQLNRTGACCQLAQWL